MAIGAPRAIDILLIIIHENLESCRLDKNKKKEVSGSSPLLYYLSL